MTNPNQLSSTSGQPGSTGWESLQKEVKFEPVAVSTEGITKIEVSDAPMGEGRQDKRVDIEGKRTSNLMLGYNEKGVQIGQEYLSLEEFKKKALEDLEKSRDDRVAYYVDLKTGKQFAEPRQVVDDMVANITGAGPEIDVSDNTKITNQDARSVEFGGPNGATQRGVFMMGNNGVKLPNGTYAEAGTIEAVINNYAQAVQTEVPVPPKEIPEPEPDPDPEKPPESNPEDPKEIGPDPQKKNMREATLELAELYAKSRRLVAGPGVREKFEAARKEYEKLMVEQLSQIGHAKYETGFKTLSSGLQTMADQLAAENVEELTNFVGGDLKHPNKTPEEIEAKREELRRAAEARMQEKYPSMVEGFETTVTAEVIKEYAKMRADLEKATIDALDNGTACRKAVSKIINNKWVKRGLMVAAATGLAVAAVGIGRGVADGSLSVSFGYTAGGVAAGALRGGLTAFLMSRQDSKNSAIRNYGDEKTIKEKIEAGGPRTIEGLAAQAMSEYGAANKTDLTRNRVSSAVSTTIGAGLGAAASGIHVDKVVNSTTTEQIQTGTNTEQVQVGSTTERVPAGTETIEVYKGTTPETYEVDLGKIDIAPGYGMEETFADLGGDTAKLNEALEIAHQFDPQHGMVPGSNGATAGVGGRTGNFAHTYPGKVETWPEEAREYIAKVAEEWAKRGLIDAKKTGGEPIIKTIELPVFETIETPIYEAIETPVFSVLEKTVVDYIPHEFWNMIVQAEAMALAGAGGSLANPGVQEQKKTNAQGEGSESLQSQQAPELNPAA